MIFSKVRQLRFAKEEQEGRRLTYEVMQKETGLSPGTLARLMKREPLDRVETTTLDTLCEYFGCGVGDVLEYQPAAGKEVQTG